MKNISKSIFYIAAAFAIIGCAKAETEGANVAGKRYFDAWIRINYILKDYPDLKATWDGVERTDSNGIYILKNTDGTGAEITDEGYAIVDYTTYDISGNITDYTGKSQAKQLGQYDTSKYYGPKVWPTMDQAIQAGLQNALVGMKVGVSRKVIIPSWLMTYSSYSSVTEYLKHSSDYSNTIYEFTVTDFTEDIDKWQVGKIEDYITENYGNLNAFETLTDTTGFYFRKETVLPAAAEAFPDDTTIYINYTGKLLNGLVFDTTDEKTAKDNGIYNASRTYEPAKINWGSEFGDITMGTDASSIITGFAMTLWRLRYVPNDTEWKDRCTGIFYSSLGYGYSGSGSSIPGYAPLIFEIEVVDKPE